MKSIATLAAFAAGCLAIASPALAQQRYAQPTSSAQDEEARFEAARQRFDREYDQFQQALDRYKQFRSRTSYNDRGPGGYDDRYDDPNWDAAQYYRSGPNYQERVLSQDDRVYRGNDGRYYCRRSDGTTGLIVGAAAGGLFGNALSNRRSSTVGTLLGAIAGASIGASVDRNNQQVRCR